MLLSEHGNEERLCLEEEEMERMGSADAANAEVVRQQLNTTYAPQPPTLKTMALSQNLVISRSKTAI